MCLDRTFAPWKLIPDVKPDFCEANGLKIDADKPLHQPRKEV